MINNRELATFVFFYFEIRCSKNEKNVCETMGSRRARCYCIIGLEQMVVTTITIYLPWGLFYG